MRKLIVLIMTFLLLCALFAGCGGSKAKTANSQDNSSTSLSTIKKAAKDAGYTVTDNYISFGMDDIKGGFSVEIIADDKDVIYSILECSSEDSAVKNAKTINDAGHNIAIRNGKILSCYGVEDKDGVGKDLLEAILKGKPITQNQK